VIPRCGRFELAVTEDKLSLRSFAAQNYYETPTGQSTVLFMPFQLKLDAATRTPASTGRDRYNIERRIEISVLIVAA